MSRIDELIQNLCPYGVEYRQIGEIAEIGTGSNNTQDAVNNGQFPFYVRSKYIKKSDTYSFDEEAIIIPGEGGIGDIIHYVIGRYALHQRAYRIHFKNTLMNTKFAYYYFSENFKEFITKHAVNATVSSIRKPMISKFNIPVPPLPIQQDIINILDKFTDLEVELEAELEARKKQYEHYRNELLNFKGNEVEWKELRDVCVSITAGGDLPEYFKKGQISPTKEFPYPIFSNSTELKGLYGYTNNYKIGSDAVTISARGAKVGYHTTREANFTPIIRLITLIPDKNIITTKFLNYILDLTPIAGTKGGIPQLIVPTVNKIQIPIPNLTVQERIVSILDKFDALVNDTSIGLHAEIKARRKQYEYYRSKLLTFKKIDNG